MVSFAILQIWYFENILSLLICHLQNKDRETFTFKDERLRL